MCHQGVCIVTGQAAGCSPIGVDVDVPVTCRCAKHLAKPTCLTFPLGQQQAYATLLIFIHVPVTCRQHEGTIQGDSQVLQTAMILAHKDSQVLQSAIMLTSSLCRQHESMERKSSQLLQAAMMC